MQNDWIDKLLMSKWFYFILTIIFIALFAYIFKWQHFCYWFDEGYQVNHELFGTFGDFVGGVLGTLFAMISIILLIRTFNQQRVVTEENKKLAEIQRFNNLFFEILRLYQEQEKELQAETEDDVKKSDKVIETTVITCNNKDFFDVNMKVLQDAFTCQTSFRKNHAEALNEYMMFYIKYKSKLSICYRTLYRLYDLIDRAHTIDESSKKNYLKIVRAQLTESELFFLRYNAMSFYGSNFIGYINKYNVLKHLPTFELLEFKDWSKDTSPIERIGINIIFSFIEKIIDTKLKSENSDFVIKLPMSPKYMTRVIIDNHGSRISMLCFIHNKANNSTQEYSGFDKFTPKRIQALFDCFLKEIFVYKNFQKINTIDSLDFFSQKIERKGEVDCIVSGVQTRNDSSLKIRAEYFSKN